MSLTAAVVVLGLVGAACGSDGEATSEPVDQTPATDVPQPGGRLVVGVPVREPETVLRLVFEPLTTFAADGTVVPYLAESVEPNETFDRWTIRVRPDITFQNGTPLDAAAVKANLDTYGVSPAFVTDPLAPITSTTVVDDLTLEVELDQPWASFPAALTAEQSQGTGLIAAPETLEVLGPLFLGDPEVAGAFGTGPFVLKLDESVDDGWVLQRNPDYWRDGMPYLDEIEVRVISENASRIAAIDSGDIDIAITNQPPADAADAQVATTPGDVPVLAVAFNMLQPPLDDPRVREALAAATNVETLASTAGVDPAAIATGPFDPDSMWSDPTAEPVPFDLARAQQLIDDYEQTNGPVTIRLAAQGLGLDDIAVQQELSAQWTEAGVEVDISVIDPFERTTTLLVTADFDAVLASLFGMPDPDGNYFWWHSTALRTETKGVGYNYIGIDDPQIDEALDAQRATADQGERQEAFLTVQQRLAAAQPYLWLWGDRWSAVAHERVHGLDGGSLPDGGTRWPMVASRLNLDALWIEQ